MHPNSKVSALSLNGRFIVAKPANKNETGLTVTMSMKGLGPRLYKYREYPEFDFTVYEFEKLDRFKDVIEFDDRCAIDSYNREMQVEFESAIDCVLNAWQTFMPADTPIPTFPNDRKGSLDRRAHISYLINQSITVIKSTNKHVFITMYLYVYISLF